MLQNYVKGFALSYRLYNSVLLDVSLKVSPELSEAEGTLGWLVCWFVCLSLTFLCLCFSVFMSVYACTPVQGIASRDQCQVSFLLFCFPPGRGTQ